MSAGPGGTPLLFYLPLSSSLIGFELIFHNLTTPPPYLDRTPTRYSHLLHSRTIFCFRFLQLKSVRLVRGVEPVVVCYTHKLVHHCGVR